MIYIRKLKEWNIISKELNLTAHNINGKKYRAESNPTKTDYSFVRLVGENNHKNNKFI